MKMDKVAGSKNDEFYTPAYAIKPILKYIKPNSNIWCPFDTEESNFTKILSNQGHNVISTHIKNGENFFDLVNSDLCDFADYIISNPPYSLKKEVFDALFKSEKPFAMLVGVVGLFESQKRFEMFRDNDFEIMYLNRRVSYFKNYGDQKPSLNPPFSSVYLCSKILPKQIIFEEIDKNDKGENYENLQTTTTKRV
jgi:predicted ribosome quality control (RQC) complex YloA/Tae2 family protein